MTLNQPADAGTLGRRIDGWKAIAAYAERSERALQRWATERGFPVHRVGGGTSGSVFAWTGEVDAWFARQATELAEPPDDVQAASPAPARATNGRAPQPVQEPVALSRWHQAAWLPVLAGTVAGLVLGMAGMWLALRPRTTTTLEAGALEPCHAVEWPSGELSALGGRIRVPVKALASPCTHWVAPTTESTWLLVTPPSTATTPPKVSMHANHPLAMPQFEPTATSLSLEVAANDTTTPREALLQFGNARVRIRQAAARTACAVEPGPGYVDGAWRYRLTPGQYGKQLNLLARVRAEVGASAEGVSWPMLKALLDGRPDRGLEFAEAVGIPRHTWEEQATSAACLNIWLTESEPPMFVSYHLGRKPLSYAAYSDINNDQFNLGTWTHTGHALYRERVR